MKKTVILFLLVLFWLNFVTADCLDFDEWQLCLSVENKGMGNYEVNRNFQAEKDYDYIVLSCRILAPNNRLKNIWTCDESFSYNWNWYEEVKFYVDLQEDRKTLDTKLQFVYFNNYQWWQFKAVYNMWPELFDWLQTRYPSLQDNENWLAISDAIYDSMNDIKNTNRSNITSYNEFYNIIVDYITYTSTVK